jgi:AcrR family transcriptional regulator
VVIPLAGQRRADARRNYEQLLEQAKIAFAESGMDASLDEIARRAGVASGTLYRHFPTRLDLVEAVLAEQIAELASDGRALLTAEDEFDALTTWLRATLAHALTYRGLAAEVMNSALDRGNDLVAAWHAELFEVGAALLARTRQSGVVAAAADVLKMVGAIAWAAPDNPGQADRLLTLLINGLAPRQTGDGPALEQGAVMIKLADIREHAMALPEVEEKPHFRLPAFRVADKLLAHLEKGDEHAIVCVGQAEAETAAADQPDVYEVVWRNGRFFVGLRVDLAKVDTRRMRELIEHAWRNRAPKRLIAEYDNRH